MFWSKEMDSRGKAVLITGCDTGFGNRLAVRLNGKGFRVYATVLDSNSMGSHELMEKCHFKDIMTIIQMDVTNEQQIDDCFNTVKADLEANGEQLWALVNNAGVISFGMIEWGSFDEYKRLFDINVFGTVRVTRKFIPLLRPTQGRIVLMASLGGRVTSDLMAPYCMTKHAIVSLSDALRREMKKFRIKVVTIEPATFKTALFYSFEESLRNNWRNTDQNIQQIYGEHYPEFYLEQNRKNGDGLPGHSGAGNIDLVIEDMMKAILSPNPSRFYRPVKGRLTRLFNQFIGFVPQLFIDIHFDRFNNVIPEYMKDKKQDN